MAPVALVFQLRQDGGKQKLDAAPPRLAGAQLEVAPRSIALLLRQA
jgi:hypothetical protein